MDGNGPALCQRCTRIFEPHEGAWKLPAAVCPQCMSQAMAAADETRLVSGCPACLLTEHEVRRLEFVRWLLERGRLKN